MSLALEFASVTAQADDEAGAEDSAAAVSAPPREVNQELRDEAAKELEAAIESTKLKLQNKEVELATLHSPEDNDISRKQITETKEIIADMEQRVSLRTPVPPRLLADTSSIFFQIWTRTDRAPPQHSWSTCAARRST